MRFLGVSAAFAAVGLSAVPLFAPYTRPAMPALCTLRAATIPHNKLTGKVPFVHVVMEGDFFILALNRHRRSA